jgi:hypothetical protein
MSSPDKQLQLVTYEQAKALKEAGFDWKCMGYFHYNIENTLCESFDPDNENYNDVNEWGNWISRPTIAHAFMWLREVHRLYVDIPINDDGEFYASLKYGKISVAPGIFSTYPEAELSILTKALEILKNKNGQ